MKSLILLLLPLFFLWTSCENFPAREVRAESVTYLADAGGGEEILDSTHHLNRNTAIKMIQAYLSHESSIKTKVRMDETDSLVPLQGIMIDVELLRSIIDTAGRANENVKAIYIMPAVRECDVGNSPTEQFFTFILAGVKNDNTLMENHLKDYFHPCPSTCLDNSILQEVYPTYPGAVNIECE